jgi:preprotein translocase SecE subunit
VSELTKILIWVAVVLVAFIAAWRMGHIAKLTGFWREMMVELEKCTWPTWEELWGSTALIGVSVALLGGFTVIVNAVFAWVVKSLLA